KTDKPTVEGAKVERGTQLRVIGPLRPADDGYYLPVEPPATEVRYVRREAVVRKGSENTAGAPPAPTPGSDPAAPPAPPGFSGPGWLRRAGRTLDYNTLYVLENSRGVPILYATAQPGYSLDVYANQNVELLGTQQYRGDLRAYHMTVMQIRPLPLR